jgi:hypothetical protein
MDYRNSVRPFIWGSNVYGASFSVSFSKTPGLELIPIMLEIDQKQAAHDFASIYFKGKPYKLESQVQYNDPVEITYRSDKTTYKFHGYVHAIRQITGTTGTTETIVECVSASSILKESAQKVYTKTTADQVISQVCASFGLSAVTQRDPRVRNAIVHSGQSYWQLFRSLALQTGNALRAENTTITFCSKDKITNSKKTSAPYFVLADNANGGVVTRELRNLGSIVEFNPIVSNASPETGSNVDRVVTGRATSSSNPKGKAIKTTHTNAKSSASAKGAVKPSKDYFKK